MTRDENPFELNLQSTKEVKIQNIQFKILHNIYPTLKHLHKWNIKESPNCTHCQVPETTIHAIAECPIAKDTFENFQVTYQRLTGIILNITNEESLLGVKKTIPNSSSINTILTLMKQRLILQRENKHIITQQNLEVMILNQFNMEKYVAKKQNRGTHLKRRWHPNILNQNIT